MPQPTLETVDRALTHYRVTITFMGDKKPQKISNFFSPHLKYQAPLQKRKLFPLLRGGLNFLIPKVGSG